MGIGKKAVRTHRGDRFLWLPAGGDIIGECIVVDGGFSLSVLFSAAGCGAHAINCVQRNA
ncbi:hypothetical protein PQU63_07200 [Xanthomonas protegens]|uniref:Uncharacterized protein n=1 Tax=Xanthomonas protegens TaxID=3380705 RepID=A0ABU9L9E6_9XANT